MSTGNNLKGKVSGEETFRIRTPCIGRAGFVIVEVAKGQMKIYSRPSNILQICGGLGRMIVIARVGKAKAGGSSVSYYRLAGVSECKKCAGNDKYTEKRDSKRGQ